VNEVEVLHGRFGLVALQVADEMPAELRRRVGDFRQGFLNAVFPKVVKSTGGSGGNGVQRFGFRDGDERHLVRASPGPPAGISQAFPNPGNVFSNC
jgi:hypothetical protein